MPAEKTAKQKILELFKRGMTDLQKKRQIPRTINSNCAHHKKRKPVRLDTGMSISKLSKKGHHLLIRKKDRKSSKTERPSEKEKKERPR